MRGLTFAEAAAAAVLTTTGSVLAGGALVTRTDPERFPDLGVALWWAATTVTTVGYGDVVPGSTAGRLVGVALMFTGVGCLALLTALAASAIVVGRVRAGEREIERTEQQIAVEEAEILTLLRRLDRRVGELERDLRRQDRTVS